MPREIPLLISLQDNGNVITREGVLVGVISMDDVLLRAEPPTLGRAPELSSEEIVKTFRAINVRQLPQAMATKRAVA